MSQQLSQLSEGGFSDLISDVDNFIVENGMTEDVGLLLHEMPTTNYTISKCKEEDEYFKSVSQEFLGNPSLPPLPPKFPPGEPTNLSIEEYLGPLNFEVYIVPTEQKTPWEYSAKLNKIFIGMNLKFPIAFSVKPRPTGNLFVRATPVFSQSQFFQEFVHRCIGHEHHQDPTNKDLPKHVFQHIMRCSNDRTRYYGDKSQERRLNIVVPLGTPEAGTDTVNEFFHFVCKNSCVTGMNRKPISIIFTLEDQNGQVIGRRVVSVRICSCPRRDKEKEEKDSTPQGKKRKLQPSDNVTDTRLCHFNFNVVGKNNYQQVLRYCRCLMAEEIMNLEGTSGLDAPFRKCVNEINILLNKSLAE